MNIPVIIIDDELLIRKLIIKSVDWEGLGFTIVGEAQNSEEALALVDELTPKLAVVDINIPYINGIELVRQIRTTHPDLSIIFLTGYDDFSYAQQAIRLHAANYLLKPLNPDELTQALETVREQIINKVRITFRDSLYENKDLPQQTTKKDFFKKLIQDSENMEPLDIETGFRLFGMAELLDYSHVVFILTMKKELLPSPQEIDRIVDPLVKKLPAKMVVESTQDASGRYVLVISSPQEHQSEYADSLSQFAVFLRHQVSAAFKFSCSVGVGSSIHTPHDVATSYQQAKLALDERFYTNRETVFHYHSVKTPTGGEQTVSQVSFDARTLSILLRGGAEKDILALIRQIIRNMQQERLQRQLCTMQIFHFVTIIEKFLSERSFPLSAVLGDKCDIAHEIQALENLGQVRDWLEWLTIRVFALVADNSTTKTQMLAMRAKRYIESHYSEKSLCLDSISTHVEVTPSYISGVFKKVLGVSIVKYMTDYRIKKAKWFMDCDPLMPISEVSEAVGYSDAFYFSKVFTKQVGIAPSVYLRGKRVL